MFPMELLSLSTMGYHSQPMKTSESKVSQNYHADTLYIAIAAKMARDPACPFKAGDSVTLQIIDDSIVVKKA